VPELNPLRLFAIFAGAGAGGLLRHLLAAAVQSRAGSAFPHGTLWVNILGCLAIGVFFGLRERTLLLGDSTLWFFLTTGLCGGFTTMSTFSYETFNLLRERDYLYALGNIAGSFAACLGATAAGFFAVRAIIGGMR
jgi:CrcB protein